MRSPGPRPAKHDGDGHFIVGNVIARRVRKAGQGHEPESRQGPKRFERDREHGLQTGEGRREEQLNTVAAIEEVRSPGRTDSGGDELLGNAVEVVDVSGGRILRHLVEIRVHPKAVVVAPFGHQDRAPADLDLHERHGQTITLKLS